MKVGEELCDVVWAKAERGEDDRFKVDDLPIIFAAACAEAIRRSPDRTKAGLHVAIRFSFLLCLCGREVVNIGAGSAAYAAHSSSACSRLFRIAAAVVWTNCREADSVAASPL